MSIDELNDEPYLGSPGAAPQPPEPEVVKATKPRHVRVATISSHFNINRNPHEAHVGDVTLSEQIKAMERFVRWHTRQVEVGTVLLKQLQAQQELRGADDQISG